MTYLTSIWVRVKPDVQVKSLKSSVWKWSDVIFIINILVMFLRVFFLKYQWNFPLSARGKLLQRSLSCAYEKYLSLTFQSQNSSKVNGVFIVPFLPAFYQVRVTFFFVRACVFSFFLSVFFLEEDKWQVWGRLPLNLTRTALHCSVRMQIPSCACLFMFLSGHKCVSICLCVCRGVYAYLY